MPRSIAFLGMGIMGSAMAKRLVQAGHTVTVYNRTASRCEPLAAIGARAAATPREAARNCEIVISIVTDSPDVQEVLLGSQGAALGAPGGALFIDMSTISPETTRKIAETLRAKGFRFLDAPVTGGDIGAREGTLSILVGGEKADLDQATEILSLMGKRITHCGPAGAGQVMKACNQILNGLNLIGVIEALHLARAGGIDQKTMVEALSPGAGGSWALERLGAKIAKSDFAPGFKVKLLQKDLRIVQDTARALKLPLDGTTLAQRYFDDNEAHGEGELGTQAIYKVLERRVQKR